MRVMHYRERLRRILKSVVRIHLWMLRIRLVEHRLGSVPLSMGLTVSALLNPARYLI